MCVISTCFWIKSALSSKQYSGGSKTRRENSRCTTISWFKTPHLTFVFWLKIAAVCKSSSRYKLKHTKNHVISGCLDSQLVLLDLKKPSLMIWGLQKSRLTISMWKGGRKHGKTCQTDIHLWFYNLELIWFRFWKWFLKLMQQ